MEIKLKLVQIDVPFRQLPGTGVEVLTDWYHFFSFIICHFYILKKLVGNHFKSIFRPRLKPRTMTSLNLACQWGSDNQPNSPHNSWVAWVNLDALKWNSDGVLFQCPVVLGLTTSVVQSVLGTFLWILHFALNGTMSMFCRSLIVCNPMHHRWTTIVENRLLILDIISMHCWMRRK